MSRGHRPSTTPMDFEWTNQTGPIDARSPFFTASQTPSQQTGSKRSHSALDSPAKQSYNGHKALPATPASSLPAHIQSQAWEPRTPASVYDCSSGGETPNTPHVESDAGTPDGHLTGRSSKKAGRRDSWMAVKGWFGGSPSPSKERAGDRDRRKETNHSHTYNSKTEGRIVKRRPERSDRTGSSKRHAVPRSSDDSDAETPSSNANGTTSADAKTATSTSHNRSNVASVVQETLFERLGNFGHWLEAHPRLPAVLSVYLQFAVNSALGGCFLYLVYCAWAGIQSDVEIESGKHTAEVMVELSACALDYKRNHCGTTNMAPALENLCGVWESCMKRDPKKVARASVTAKTFAMIFNSFVDEFSYKSMIFTAIIIFGGFNLSNWAFGLLRSSVPLQPSHQHQSHSDYFPQTPHRTISASYQQQQLQFDTPYPHQQHQHTQDKHDRSWHALPPYSQSFQTPGRAGGEYSRDTTNMQFIEPPPLPLPPSLVHAHTMPAGLPTLASGSGYDENGPVGRTRTLRKRDIFR